MPMTRVYLICLRRPSPELVEKIREAWPDTYELNSSQVLVQGPVNGGPTIYERLSGLSSEDVAALVVHVQSGTFHGRHSTALWDWLGQHVGF